MELQERIGGKLPVIDIAGTEFFVDVRLHELRSDYQLMSHIDLDKLEVGPGGGTYLFAFNKETKQLVTIDPKITEWPENIIIVEIPDEVTLDPYAFAREAGIDPLEFVREHPLQKELKAKVIPLIETGFPAMMEKNKKTKHQSLIPKRNKKPNGHDKGRIR